MAAPTSGFFPKTDKKHPGWYWELFEDPASATGWTRKLVNPLDRSKTPYFEDYDYAADARDGQAAADKAAAQQARQQQAQASNGAYRENVDAREPTALRHRHRSDPRGAQESARCCSDRQ
jgi:hypothetical protein